MSDSCPQASRDVMFVFDDTDTDITDADAVTITVSVSSINCAMHMKLCVAISKIDDSTLLKTNFSNSNDDPGIDVITHCDR